MKRLVLVLASLFCLVGATFAQDYSVAREEKNMILPDGREADVLFFVKWGDADKYIKSIQPKDKKVMIGVKAKDESDLGYLRKTYKADENEAVAELCKIHAETGSMYSVAWLDYGQRVTRCVFTYKGGKLTYDRMDFFDETNGTYADYLAQEKAKQEKINNVVAGLTSLVFDAIVPEKAASNETPEQTLYRLRHETHEIISVGTRNTGGTKIVRWRYIYRDNGQMVSGYIVDLNGNIRSDMFDSKKYEYPILEYYSVPKDIRDLAQKSLN